MTYHIHLAFDTSYLERRFMLLLQDKADEEKGGILFYEYRDPVAMHWRQSRQIFGTNPFGVITDWIVCPNISNLRRTNYQVSDLEQLKAIAEESAVSRGCQRLHWHSHPGREALCPSGADKAFWWSHFNNGWWAGGAIARLQYDGHPEVVCFSQGLQKGEKVLTSGSFWSWREINRRIRNYEKRTGKKITGTRKRKTT